MVCQSEKFLGNLAFGSLISFGLGSLVVVVNSLKHEQDGLETLFMPYFRIPSSAAERSKGADSSAAA
jgi:hypothetical protein